MRIIEIMTLIVLARLLEPEHFGAAGLALVVISTINVFAQAGIGAAIIQSEEDPRRAAFNGFLVIGVSGTILTVAAWSASATIASLLKHPELVDVFRWMTLLIPVQMLGVVPTSLLMRRMHFGRQSASQIAESLTKLVTGVAAALMGMGVWSLVIAYLSGAAANTFTSQILCSTRGWLRPRFWNRDLAVTLTRFGVPLLSTGLIRRFYDNIDDVVVGAMFGTQALGFYRQAYKVSDVPVSGITQAASSVLLPSYTRLQHRRQRLGTAYVASLRMVALLTIPTAFGLLVLASEGIAVTLGEKWLPAAPILQVLAIVSLVRPLSGTTGPLFVAIGRPGLNLRTATVQGLSLAVIAPLMLQWGAIGVAWAVAITFVLGLYHNVHQVARYADVGLRVRDVVLAPARLTVSGAIMAISLVALRRAYEATGASTHTMLGLVTLVLAGAVVYGIAVFVLDRRILLELAGSLRTLTNRMSRETSRGAVIAVPGVTPEEVRTVLGSDARNRGAHLAQVTGCDHLSSWKQTGAYRIHGTADDGHPTSLVWKEARYSRDEIPALVGLPLQPGAPEFAIYSRADGPLRAILPAVYSCMEISPGTHYRYVLEDLSARCSQLPSGEVVVRTAQRLPMLHATLDEGQRPRAPELLDYDRSFPEELVGYTGSALRKLHRGGSTTDVSTVLAEFDTVGRRLREGVDRVYGSVDLVPIHGDLNPTNIWFDAENRPVLVDWEWAGVGVPHADLASTARLAGPELEHQALSLYHRHSGDRSFDDDLYVYSWSKLQRAVLDIGFVAAQIAVTRNRSAHLDLPRHLRRSLAALDAAMRSHTVATSEGRS